MRGRFLTVLLTVSLFGLVPGTAHAQGYLTPLAGVTFGKDAPAKKFTTGAAIGVLGNAAGIEFEFGYTPDFFNEQDDFAFIADSNLTTMMGTLLFGLGSSPVRPYGAAGFGIIRSRNEGLDLIDDITTNDTAINVGGGVFIFLTDHLGLRGDFRYFRSLEDPSDDDDLDVELGKFDFYRAIGTVTFKF